MPSEEDYRALLLHAADIYWEMDADLCLSRLTPVEDKGLQAAPWLGKHYSALPLPAELLQQLQQRFEQRLGFRDLECSVAVDEVDFRVSLAALPCFDAAKFTGYCGIARDISAPRSDVARQKAELAHQSEFLANISHEMRTPMHAMMSFARIGQAKVGKVDEQKLRDYFDRIHSSGERLLHLVNDLLDLAKLEEGRLEYMLQTVDLQQCVKEVVAELSPLLESKQLSCRYETALQDTQIKGDQLRLAQVLRNLLANAIKFTAAGGGIVIDISADELAVGRRAEDVGKVPALRITVTDEGVGIPDKELELIFEKFAQSSRTRSGAGGTGLGLSICREIVAAHRGVIRAHNRQGGGAIFEVILPKLGGKAA